MAPLRNRSIRFPIATMTSLNKTEVLSMMNVSVDANLNLKAMALTATPESMYKNSSYVGDPVGQTSANLSCWGYWRDYYYPTVIRESYPVYVREQAQDKGKKAFEII